MISNQDEKHFCLTENIDNAGGSGKTMDVFHLNGEVSMVSSDSVTDHQYRLTLFGLI